MQLKARHVSGREVSFHPPFVWWNGPGRVNVGGEREVLDDLFEALQASAVFTDVQITDYETILVRGNTFAEGPGIEPGRVENPTSD